MLFNIVIALHLIACVLLVIAVLMQSSKGGALSAAFGGGGGAMFGGRETATFLSKATTVLAVVFFLTSLSLALLSSGRSVKGAESALKKAAGRGQYGTVVPEEQKNVDEILGKVPEPAQGAQQGAGAKQPEKLPAPQQKSGK
jgi:preprotein translocase subunit SecG